MKPLSHPELGLALAQSIVVALHNAQIIAIAQVMAELRQNGAAAAASGKTELAAAIRELADGMDAASEE